MNFAQHRQIHCTHDLRCCPYHSSARRLPAERQLTIAARKITKALLDQAIRNMVRDFLNHTVHRPKHMVIACTEPLSSVIHERQIDPNKVPLEEPPELLNHMPANLQRNVTPETSTRTTLYREPTTDSTKTVLQ